MIKTIKSYNFDKIVKEHNLWLKKNFPNGKSYHSILGMIEEIGELSHAHLKDEEKIRLNENHNYNKKDALADTIIYLIGFCNYNNIDINKCSENILISNTDHTAIFKAMRSISLIALDVDVDKGNIITYIKDLITNLASYANDNGWDLKDIVQEVWDNVVKKRTWN